VGETILFHAPVEETALKRRTSRLLLPLPVAQRKPKVRELALTSHRLVCLKPLKNGRGVGIKAEFALREVQGQRSGQRAGSTSKRPKSEEARGMVTGVERRGAKEFVVLTVRLLPHFGFYLFTVLIDVLGNRRPNRASSLLGARRRRTRGRSVSRKRYSDTTRRSTSAGRPMRS
jgi:hypothetical protein